MKYFSWFNASFIKISTIIAITLSLWINSKASLAIFQYTPWVFIAQGLGITGIMLISINFLLATRLGPFRRIFGNLEKVYHVHKYVGIAGATFCLLHFLAFLIHSISFPTLFSFYLIPGELYSSLNYARVGLSLFIILVAISLITKIPYQIWKRTHQFMGLALLFAYLHVWTINSDVAKDYILHAWLVGWMSSAVLGFLYIKLIYPLLGYRYLHEVTEIIQLKGEVFKIKMKPLAKKLEYLPSQYIFVSFLSSKTGRESHPFTLVSITEENTIEIAPKAIGDFTRKLVDLEVGTKVKVWGPYGSFSDEFLDDEYEQVWISGGIGATPFIGMISHEGIYESGLKKWYFYCCRNPDEASFDTLLKEKTKKHKNITLVEHYSDYQGYLNMETIKHSVPDFNKKKFLICGPPPMKHMIIDNLLKEGVNRDDIIHEDFSIRN